MAHVNYQSLWCNYPKCKASIIGFATVTRCSHIFCKFHSICGVGAEKRCPSCNTVLDGEFDVVQTNVNPTEEIKSVIISGHTPEVIFDIMSRALQFWEFQQNIKTLQHKMEIESLQTRLAERERAWEAVELKVKHYIRRQEEKIERLRNEVELLNTNTKHLETQLAEKNRQILNMQTKLEELRCKTITTILTKDTEPDLRISDKGGIFEQQIRGCGNSPVAAQETNRFVFQPNISGSNLFSFPQGPISPSQSFTQTRPDRPFTRQLF